MAGQEERRQVVVDTDTVLDDALAMLHLAGSEHADVVAVTTVLLVRPDLVPASATGPVAVVGNGCQVRARVLLTPDGAPVAADVVPPAGVLPVATAVTAVDARAFLEDSTASLAASVAR